MFLTTADQQCILSVLDQTGFLRLDQVARLLRLLDNGKDKDYAARIIRQLQYMQKASWKTAELITLPHLAGKTADGDMLAAVDIMLDLTDTRLLAVSAQKPPFKLCFLTEMPDGIGSYAVIPVSRDSEAKVNFLLQAATGDQRTVILLLENLSQSVQIKTPLPHFFALYDVSRYRYFKGNS